MKQRRMLGRLLWVLAAPLIIASCGRSPDQEPPAPGTRFTSEQLEARFSWDLGEAYIDVSRYPVEQKAAYDLFRARCSLCHTLARPINAFFTSRQDWTRFVHRMHAKAAVAGSKMSDAEAKTIVDFLVYDSQARKLNRKQQFEEESARLNALFVEVQKERGNLNLEKGKEAGRPITYTGDKP